MSAGLASSSGNFVYALTAVAGRGLVAPPPSTPLGPLVPRRAALPGSGLPPSVSVPSLVFSRCLRAR